MNQPLVPAVQRAFIAGCLILSFASVAMAQDAKKVAAEAIQPYITNVEQTQEGMSLWQMMQSGGVVMIVLFVLSIGAGALVVYNFREIHTERLAPRDFAERVIDDLERKDLRSVRQQCEDQENIMARIVMAGLDRKARGAILAREAMENMVRKEVAALWQKISYLSDIAAVAPLIGLLGTVVGMIQAFNVIAFQAGVVKPILLAGGVSKAMVTTAGGLIVAIPVMLFYAYFRGRVQEVTDVVENYSTDIMKLIEEM